MKAAERKYFKDNDSLYDEYALKDDEVRKEMQLCMLFSKGYSMREVNK